MLLQNTYTSMQPTIDKERLLPQQQQPTSNPTPANGGGPDPSLASLISSQILSMQKQMERGFGLMSDKIQLIEGRVDNASQQLEMIERLNADNQSRQM